MLLHHGIAGSCWVDQTRHMLVAPDIECIAVKRTARQYVCRWLSFHQNFMASLHVYLPRLSTRYDKCNCTSTDNNNPDTTKQAHALLAASPCWGARPGNAATCMLSCFTSKSLAGHKHPGSGKCNRRGLLNLIDSLMSLVDITTCIPMPPSPAIERMQ